MIIVMENGQPVTSTATRGRDGTIAPFSAIAIHDGYQAEMQVNHAFTWLHQSFRADLRMSFNSWSFEKLVAALDIRAMSVRMGSEADVIILSTTSDEPLPDHIKRWLDSINCQQRDQRALLIALGDDARASFTHPGTLCEYLRQWAARWNADFICCADLRQPPVRQSILRRINEHFHRTLPVNSQESYTEPDTSGSLTIHQTIEKNQASMTPTQIQEVRGLAYHLWLQAGHPAGGELDFWLRAEQQIIQAAAEKVAHEASLNVVPAANSATKKLKPSAKHTQ
jgi:hypothetical protein